MTESLVIPACFSSSEKENDMPATITRSGQSVFISAYRTKLAGQCRLITITWSRNLLLHGLSVSVQATNGSGEHHHSKVELKPWHFWRKQGCKQFMVDGRKVDLVWDLNAAKFGGKTEPQSDYYVAIVCEEEVVLLLGDLKKDAYRKTHCRPSLIEPIFVSRKEHVFGKKKFTTRARFQEQGKLTEISIECSNGATRATGNDIDEFDPQLVIKADGKSAIQVKHLQWKFRGNGSIHLSRTTVDVYWDVHDWLFGSGPRHGLFIFKPAALQSSSSLPSSTTSSPPFNSQEEHNAAATLEDDNIDWIHANGEDGERVGVWLCDWHMDPN